MESNNDDKKSQAAGQPNQGIPTPRPDLKIQIGDELDESKVEMASACDQSIHEVTASKYTAYMMEKNNNKSQRPGDRVERWKQKRKDNTLRRSQLKPGWTQDISEIDISMDGSSYVTHSGLANTEVKLA